MNQGGKANEESALISDWNQITRKLAALYTSILYGPASNLMPTESIGIRIWEKTGVKKPVQ